MLKKQKFHKGDLVRVAKDLGQTMSHFKNDCDAIVIGSYKDEYGGDNTRDYTLHLKDKGKVSWYEEWQLTLLEKNRMDLLKQWKKEEKEQNKIESDLNWIFKNGKSVLKSASGSTVIALSNCLGVSEDDLCGSYGEGFVFYENGLTVLMLAKPFLQKGDKTGWLNFCRKKAVANSVQPLHAR